METLLINEQFVSQFKYWREGQVRTGMRFGKSLFDYVSKFSPAQRHQAFDLAWRLNMADKEIVVTASSEQYIVWVRLCVAQDTGRPHRSASSVFTQSLDQPISLLMVPQSVLSA